MKNHNDEALANYFSSLLTPEKPAQPVVQGITEIGEIRGTLPENLSFSDAPLHVEPVTEKQEQAAAWENLALEEQFQALFFTLSGLSFAVPLADLGGIHRLDGSLNRLLGKPAWFSGVISNHQSLFNIVDTAIWLGTGESAQTLDYTHYIVLRDTQWGLACEQLHGTKMLSRSQIKWRNKAGKQRWLAGTVKQHMCALIHAEELVKLLNNE